MAKRTVKLTDDHQGREINLPVLEPTIGKPVLDISALPELGYFTHDPGFAVTSSCESKITFIDGGAGKLLYRGYPIEEVAKKLSFLDTAYLLYYGEVPTEQQSKEYIERIKYHRNLNECVRSFFHGFHYDAHPMAIMTGIIGSMSAFYPDASNIHDANIRYRTALRLLAKMPMVAAGAYRKSADLPIIYPHYDEGYTEGFLRILFERPGQNYEPDPLAAKAMDLLFILHADHEQNASTSTVRLAGSTGTNPYAAVAAGIAALWGPSHGGANEAVLDMLEEIDNVSNINKFLDKAKDKDDPFKLMGFGHRVYRNYDPRARIIQDVCYKLLERYGNDPRMELALKLEESALKDDYFIERKLYPNVDFYSGIIYSALGIPKNLFTVMFAVARTAGWIAHWNELMSNSYRIGRPRQLYTGSLERKIS